MSAFKRKNYHGSNPRKGSSARREQKPVSPHEIRPLPPYCHLEFHEFLDDYTKYLECQISTFQDASIILPTDWSFDQLRYYQSILKAIKHIRWVGTRTRGS